MTYQTNTTPEPLATATTIATCYVAGPMTGYPDLNFPLFHATAAHWRALGWHVINPAEINIDPAAGWVACMRADIKQLVDCDTIVLLPGWQNSKGASLEHYIARQLGMNVIYPRAASDDKPLTTD